MKAKNIILIAIIVISCNGNKKSENNNTKETSVSYDVSPIASLADGEILLNDDSFGEIIELKGASHPVEPFVKVSETEMMTNDSMLIVRNKNKNNWLMIFSLPDFKFIKSLGIFGRGPGEFQSPHLVKAPDNNALCYIFESSGNKLYSLNRNLEISKLDFKLPESKREMFSDKQMFSISDSSFAYVESADKGKAIFQMDILKDSISSRQIHNLSFSGKYNNWASYIGDFGVNPKYGRMVFAYKYFRRLIFFDMNTEKSRILTFKSENVKAGDPLEILNPSNITHYWGISAQKKYVYFLYSGRTPVDVHNELQKNSGYIYVEQYDWNGNPIHKYKLDHWGYFCVNEAEDTIYLASTTDEQPFYSYTLSKVH